MEFTENKIAIALSIAAIISVVALIGGDEILSALEFEDNCEWQPIEAEDGQTFSDLDELEQEIGSDRLDEVIEQAEQDENFDIRETSEEVQFLRCNVEP